MLLQAERQKLILATLEQKGAINAHDLSKEINASVSTLRRDLYELERANKLVRTHGGAISNNYSLSVEQSVRVKQDIYTDEKKRIAQAAASLIKSGNTIILDSSTTANAMVDYISAIPNITVITNDLYNINKLRTCKNIDLMTVGGLLRKGSYTNIGYFCELMLEKIHADKAFIGVDAISPTSGLMICAQEGTRQKKLMVSAASEAIVICDHSKFTSRALVSFCEIKDVSCIITGSEALEYSQILNDIRTLGTKVITA